jgi:hypothetical protein
LGSADITIVQTGRNSLLIATCVILASRTAKWLARFDEKLSHQELDDEIDYAVGLASRVLSRPMAKRDAFNASLWLLPVLSKSTSKDGNF